MSNTTTEIVRKGLKARYAAERRFKYLGMLAVVLSLSFLFILLYSVTRDAIPAFTETHLELELDLSPEALDIGSARDEKTIRAIDYDGVIKSALRTRFTEVSEREDRRRLYELYSPGAIYKLADQLVANPEWLGTKRRISILAGDDTDLIAKGLVNTALPESERRFNDQQVKWIHELQRSGQMTEDFNITLFTAGDSREPEQAGIYTALVGTIFTMLVTFSLAFPIGVLAAIYLEEFAPVNRLTDFIEININNLAAVPSVVFGLLGLAVFLNLFGMPRSAPLVGGCVLALMTLPTIIIASRSSLKAVPASIRDAALGLGASKVQMVFQHVLPLAMPGILTGAIIGMAHALGETAPLLMIGMVAFIVDIPHGITSPSTVLPVQIYLWSDSPEYSFAYRTAAAILVLLTFLVCMNAIAVFLRKRFERRW